MNGEWGCIALCVIGVVLYIPVHMLRALAFRKKKIAEDKLAQQVGYEDARDLLLYAEPDLRELYRTITEDSWSTSRIRELGPMWSEYVRRYDDRN